MKNHRFFFDYIYYRMTKFYFKWDGSHGITAIVGISMIQLCILGIISGLFQRFIFDNINSYEITKTIVIIQLIIFGFLCVYNFKRYEGKYKVLRDHWQHETKDKQDLKSFLVLLSLIIPWIVLFAIISVK